MEGDLDDIVEEHEAKPRIVCIALGDMLQRQIDLLNVVGEEAQHGYIKLRKS